MALSHYDLIQINATLIVGLIIILTFQTLVPPILHEKIQVFDEELQSKNNQLQKITLFMTEACPTTYNNFTESNAYKQTCDDLQSDFNVAWGEYVILWDSGVQAGYLDRTNAEKNLTGELQETPFILNIINLTMIFPFILSSIIETILVVKKDAGDDASKKGIKIMLIGFILMGIGFASMAYMTYYYAHPFMFQSDSDYDGLFDDEEEFLKTNPQVADMDEDGLTDGEEVNWYYTDPLQSDTDGDQLLDGDEVFYYTNPLNRDTDGDGYLDGEEVNSGSDPTR